jgi:hypothetical protein
MPKYLFMVQRLIKTNALEDDLARAYMAETTAKMLEGKMNARSGVVQTAPRSGWTI